MALMHGARVQVPASSVTPLAAESVLITGRCSVIEDGLATVYVLCVPEGDPPSSATILSVGYPVTSERPLVIDDPNGSTLPDLSRYFASVSGLTAGDLRIIS